jgi:hypothetical protein
MHRNHISSIYRSKPAHAMTRPASYSNRNQRPFARSDPEGNRTRQGGPRKSRLLPESCLTRAKRVWCQAYAGPDAGQVLTVSPPQTTSLPIGSPGPVSPQGWRATCGDFVNTSGGAVHGRLLLAPPAGEDFVDPALGVAVGHGRLLENRTYNLNHILAEFSQAHVVGQYFLLDSFLI